MKKRQTRYDVETLRGVLSKHGNREDVKTGDRGSAYDLEFVILAQQLLVPLYTQDRQALAAFPALARPLRDLR